jgi:hypothetical protein
LVPATLSGEAFNLLANLAVGFAGLMVPLALVSIVSGLHPLFLFVYEIRFTLFFRRSAGSASPVTTTAKDWGDRCQVRR